jgi:alcohol dehydrogenase class IV
MAVVMLLPAAWQYYLGNPEVCKRTMELAPFFPGETPEQIIESFKKFISSMGVPPSLAAYPLLTPALMEQTAKSAGANKMKLELAPRPVPLEDSEKILSQILIKAYKGE